MPEQLCRKLGEYPHILVKKESYTVELSETETVGM